MAATFCRYVPIGVGAMKLFNEDLIRTLVSKLNNDSKTGGRKLSSAV